MRENGLQKRTELQGPVCAITTKDLTFVLSKSQKERRKREG